MHHAYPQECPFPRSVRGQSTLTPEDWSMQTNLKYLLNNTELRLHAETDLDHEDRGIEVVPWSSTEELVSFHWEGLEPKQAGHSIWRKWMALLAVACLIVPMMRAWSAALDTASAALGTTGPKMLEKQMV